MNKLFTLLSQMAELIKKIPVNTAIKPQLGIKPASISAPEAPAAPEVTLDAQIQNVKGPKDKKDPVKVAEQIKDPQKKEQLKFKDNGQWRIE